MTPQSTDPSGPDRSVGLAVERPVFLVGAERSGTTMLRLMLDAHPDISFLEEFEYAVESIPAEGWPDVEEYVDRIVHHRVFQLHGAEIDRSLDYPSLVNSFLRQQLDDDAAVCGATIHFSIDKILRIWPDARFIHIVRDPRDVGRSAVAMSWGGTVWGGIDKWIAAQDEWETIRSAIDDDRYIELSFDGLVDDYRTVLGQVCDFLGVDYTDEMLSYADRTDYELPSQSATTSNWKDSLSEREVRMVEAKVGSRLEEAGFAPSGLPSLELSPMRRRLLDVENKLKRPLSRARILGWPLSLGLTIARQTGPASIREPLERRANERINANRKRSWS